MTELRVHALSVSLDGYAAGPGQSPDEPLGVGGEQLHERSGGCGLRSADGAVGHGLSFVGPGRVRRSRHGRDGARRSSGRCGRRDLWGVPQPSPNLPSAGGCERPKVP